MKKDNTHYNIKERLNNAFEIYGDLLDVGCGDELVNLMDFDNSPFKSLVGIDREIPDESSVKFLYKNYLKTKEVEFDIMGFWDTELHKKLNLKCDDILNYHYGIDKYGLIICTSALHFFCDEIKYALICRFYKALKKKGLIFIRVNHSKHLGDTNPKYSRRICHVFIRINLNSMK